MRKSKLLSIVIIVLMIFLTYCSSKKKKMNPVIKRYNTATVFLNNGKFQIAEKYLKEVIEKDPKFYLAYNSLGIIEIYKRNFDKAEQYLLKVVSINPTFMETYNYLGVVYKEKGLKDKAKKMFLKVAESQNYPTRENGYYNLALIYLSESNLDEALKYANKAVRTNAFFALGYNLKGKILMRLKKNDESRVALLKAVKLMPENPYFNFDVALFLYKIENNYERALKFFERTLILSKDNNLKNVSRKYIKEIDRIIDAKKHTQK